MARKRRVVYPPSRSSKGPAPVYVPPVTPPTVAKINLQAGLGKNEIVPGMRVTILGTGLYAGDTVVVESVIGGVIPAALIRTDAGQTRRVRTVDLAPAAPAPAEPTPAPAEPAPAPAEPAPSAAAEAPRPVAADAPAEATGDAPSA